jgi:hypothetical protein
MTRLFTEVIGTDFVTQLQELRGEGPMSIFIERLIAASAIMELLAAGYAITVNDGEDDVLIDSLDPAAIERAMRSTDEDKLYVRPAAECARTPDARVFTGWVYFVYGNDGPDVINDYTTNLEAYLVKTNALAEKLS